jgi:hypothetical protein
MCLAFDSIDHRLLPARPRTFSKRICSFSIAAWVQARVSHCHPLHRHQRRLQISSWYEIRIESHTGDPTPNGFRPFGYWSGSISHSDLTATHTRRLILIHVLFISSSIFSGCFIDEHVSLLLSCGESESSEIPEERIVLLGSEGLISHRITHKSLVVTDIIREPGRFLIVDNLCSLEAPSMLNKRCMVSLSDIIQV